MDVRFTKHAAQRWAERVRVGLDEERAAADLAAAGAAGEVRVLQRSERRGPEPHLVVGGVALPLVRSGGDLVAVTCVPLAGGTPRRGDGRLTRRREGRRRREPYRRPHHVDWLLVES